ncbi:site-2 protease family protein [Paraliomyxa miuraensis]|uniref:site-2 protease family protein n=1 Tax=Paraliomyxa miuraensis TaxID=376150 RepID=UPI002255FE18|nr:site-2 protease family protein [Paraliomyxa miuraensis]MCX4247142.1 site-2 protease family protein [Paraliomyxa miuraensis]
MEPRTSTQRAASSASTPPPSTRSDRPVLVGGPRLGTAFGVEIQVDWSLLVIFALITVNLGAGVFPSWHPEWGMGLSWVMALAAATLFFASVLAHELSHAVVARARGIPVSRITLFLFGGVAQMEDEPKSPKDELLMTIVGPLVSLMIGGVAILVASLLASDTVAALSDRPEAALRAMGPVATLLMWLGPINVLLGLFNLVPGFPLDGGRVARAIIWWITGDLVKATRWATGLGRGFAWILMGIGVLELFGGLFVQGLWLVLIGWFLNNAAQMSYAQLLMRRALEHVPVSRIMFTRVGSLSPEISVESFVREHLLVGDQQAFPVEDGGRLLGLATAEDVRRVPQERWPVTMVGDIMTRAEELATLTPQADAEEAMSLLSRRDVEQLPVVEAGHVVGLVRRRDLVRWLALQGGRELRLVDAAV